MGNGMGLGLRAWSFRAWRVGGCVVMSEGWYGESEGGREELIVCN